MTFGSFVRRKPMPISIIARALIESHGLTLQQNKTKIVSAEFFRQTYLRENEKREVDTLSERFYDLLDQLGISDTYEDIDYDSLSPEYQSFVDQLNLEGILEEQLALEEPDLSLMKFILRRLGQLNDEDAIDPILKSFEKMVPVIKETVEYLLRLSDLDEKHRVETGARLLQIYEDSASPASHLEYSRMYLLRPFADDARWNSDEEYVRLYNDAPDEFSRRELLLAMGRSKKDFWFRSRKQYLGELSPWLRRAFIYAASCLPNDEYRHWVRGIDKQLDDLERAIAVWALRNPIHN
jgi:hypothetical protein